MLTEIELKLAKAQLILVILDSPLVMWLLAKTDTKPSEIRSELDKIMTTLDEFQQRPLTRTRADSKLIIEPTDASENTGNEPQRYDFGGQSRE